jgi:hypothetical protein
MTDQPNGMTQMEIDQRVFDLYDEYCHGRIARREFLSRAAAGHATVGIGRDAAHACGHHQRGEADRPMVARGAFPDRFNRGGGNRACAVFDRGVFHCFMAPGPVRWRLSDLPLPGVQRRVLLSPRPVRPHAAAGFLEQAGLIHPVTPSSVNNSCCLPTCASGSSRLHPRQPPGRAWRKPIFRDGGPA